MNEVYLTKKKRKLEGKRLEAFDQFWIAFNYKKGRAEAADSWLDIPLLTDQIVRDILLAAKSEALHRDKAIDQGRTPKMAQGWLTARRWEDEDKVIQMNDRPTITNSYDNMLRGLNILTNLGEEKFHEFCRGVRMDENDKKATFYKWKMSQCQNPICRNRVCDVRRLARSAVRGI